MNKVEIASIATKHCADLKWVKDQDGEKVTTWIFDEWHLPIFAGMLIQVGRQAAKQQLVDWMVKEEFDVHQETFEGLLKSLENQIARNYVKGMVKAAKIEREECAKLLEEMDSNDRLSNYYKVAAVRIRERGKL